MPVSALRVRAYTLYSIHSSSDFRLQDKSRSCSEISNLESRICFSSSAPSRLYRGIETITANELSAAFRAVFLIAIRMVLPARHHVAVGTAEPVRKMELLGIIRHGLKGLSVRVFNRDIRLACCDGCVRHFFLAFPANPHHPSRLAVIQILLFVPLPA